MDNNFTFLEFMQLDESFNISEIFKKFGGYVTRKVANYYKILEKRYGSKHAKLIIITGLMGFPVPIPGAMFLTASPALIYAELVKRFQKAEEKISDTISQ